MKKIIKIQGLLIVALLVICLAACGKNKNIEVAGDNTDTTSTEEAASDNAQGNLADDGDNEAGEITIPKFDKDSFPKIDGSTATLPLGQLMYRMSTGASELEAATDIEFTRTTESYIQLIDGNADLVIAYEAGERAKNYAGYEDLIIEPIGLDALVFLCNQRNKIDSLSADEIRGIYTGEYTDWSDLGGATKEIIPFQRPENSGSQTLMEKLMMKGTPMIEAPEELTPGEMGDLIEDVASYDNSANAIGYSVYYYAANMYKVPEIKLLAVDGVMPESNTIRSGEYEYVNPFYVAIKKDAPENSPQKLLFDWLTNEDGQSLINALGYVAIKDSSKTLPEDYQISNVNIDLGDEQLLISAGIYNGNAGVIVFDNHLKPEKYISEIGIYGGADYAISKNNLILARSTEIKTSEQNVGLYDLEKQKWIVAPEYEGVAPYYEDGVIEKYYFYSYQYSEDEYSATIDVADVKGNLLKEAATEEDISEAYLSSYLDNYTTDYQEDYNDFYFANRVKLHREDGENWIGNAELYIDDKLIQKANNAHIIPAEAVISWDDELPRGYIAVKTYDVIDYETYEIANNTYILIDDKGDLVYNMELPPNEAVIMGTRDYCLIYAVGGRYKLVNSKGETITSWRYEDYDDIEEKYLQYNTAANHSVSNNGNYFVKIDDKVYFREYGKKALENPTIWGDYLYNPTGESSYIDYYDETEEKLVRVFEDFGHGIIAYMDGKFFMTGKDFSTNEYGIPYVYAMDMNGNEATMPELIHGEIKGVSKDNDMVFVESAYDGTNNNEQALIGIAKYGDRAFTINSEGYLYYIGNVDNYLIYEEVFYQMGQNTQRKLWCRDIYTDETTLIIELEYDAYTGVRYGELYTSEGKYYIPYILTEGTGQMFNGGSVIQYIPGKEKSGKYAADFYEYDDGAITVFIDGVERDINDKSEDTYYIKRASFNEAGDLYLKQKNGDEYLQVKGFIPSADYYETRKDMTLAESVDGTGFLMLATQIYDEEGSIGWRDGFRLLKMEYLKINDDGTYDVIQTVNYE